LPRVALDIGEARIRTHDLLIANPIATRPPSHAPSVAVKLSSMSGCLCNRWATLRCTMPPNRVTCSSSPSYSSTEHRRTPSPRSVTYLLALRAGCSKAEPKIFAPPQTPFPGAWDGQNLISWSWSLLPLPTNLVRIDASNFELSW